MALLLGPTYTLLHAYYTHTYYIHIYICIYVHYIHVYMHTTYVYTYYLLTYYDTDDHEKTLSRVLNQLCPSDEVPGRRIDGYLLMQSLPGIVKYQFNMPRIINP